MVNLDYWLIGAWLLAAGGLLGLFLMWRTSVETRQREALHGAFLVGLLALVAAACL